MTFSCSSRFNRIVDLLGGLKLSFILMVLLGLLVAQRAVISQKVSLAAGTEAPAFIRLMNLFGLDTPEFLTAPFVAIMLLFLINLFFSCIIMLRRVKSRLKAIRSFRDTEFITELDCQTVFELPSGCGERLAAAFRKKGYRVRINNNLDRYQFTAVKREQGTWGVLFFHLTFFVVVLGVAASLLTRFSGYVELSPGEVFIEKKTNYRRMTERPLLFSHDRGFSLRLEEIDLSYWRPGEVKQRASILSVFDSSGTFIGQERIEVNDPLHIDGINVYQGSRHGFIAGLDVSDEAGTVIHMPVAFRISEDGKGKLFQMASLPGAGLNLELELFTDQLAQIEGLESLSRHGGTSLLKVSTLDSLGRKKFRGALFGGTQIAFEGLTLNFVSLKPYASLVMVSDYGIPVVFTGLALLLLGLIVTYFWVPECFWCVVVRDADSDHVVMGGFAEKYQESFRERFADMADDLRKEALG